VKDILKLLYILNKDIKGFTLVLLAFLLESLLETISIGLIGPYISLAANPSFIDKSALLLSLFTKLNVTQKEFVALIGAGIAVTFVIKSILYFFSQLAIFKFSFGLQQKIELRLFKAYLLAPYTFYLGKNSSSIIKNISLETHNFSHNFLIPILQAITNLITVILLTTLLGCTNLLLLSIILGGILPVFILFILFRKKIKHWGEEGSSAIQGMIRTVNHGLGSFKETRVLGCEFYFLEQMEEETRKLELSQLPYHVSQRVPRILLEALLIIPLVVFVSIAQFSESNNQSLIATLSIFAVAAIRLMPAASHFLISLGSIQSSTHILDTLYHDLKTLEQHKDSDQLFSDTSTPANVALAHDRTSEYQPYSFTDRISLDKVVYRYPESADPALIDISLEIRKGESIGLIGKSGSGKTTLVDVILGLLKPESGMIYIDNISIHNNIRALQSLIGYIPQSIFLTDDTIGRNIAFGVPDHLISKEKLEKSIALAQLQELVEQLPNGVQTVVGERGIRLSGGQRQRIGIARVLYHEKEILVLDEATSALDGETEAAISEAIQNLSGIKTLIIIAHRLTTIQHCDVVYTLDKGRIIKAGSYQDVANHK
jgi:ABC-type bacteriocin/lantibiotic exporter with double-glycine peptidase domain